MADVNYQCPTCKAERMVSEFADPAKIMCRNCNCHMRQAKHEVDETIPTPSSAPETPPPPSSAPQPKPSKKNKLKLAREKQPVLPPDESPGVVKSKKSIPPETPPTPLELHPKTKRKKKPLLSPSFLSFLLLVVVGGCAGYVRYGMAIETTPVAPALEYTWVAVLCLHLFILSKAFAEDIMQGIFCFFIPGWSFIYLAISDHMYLKAIVFGLLVGIGYDGGIQLADMASNGLSQVQSFIDSGGGSISRH